MGYSNSLSAFSHTRVPSLKIKAYSPPIAVTTLLNSSSVAGLFLLSYISCPCSFLITASPASILCSFFCSKAICSPECRISFTLAVSVCCPASGIASGTARTPDNSHKTVTATAQIQAAAATLLHKRTRRLRLRPTKLRTTEIRIFS